jgi:hypothetical protein
MSANGELLEQRLAIIDSFMQLRDATAVAATARQLDLRWFLLDPGDRVEWPDDLANRPVFALGGYKLYRF